MISPSLLVVEVLEVTAEVLEVTVGRFCLPGRTIAISARASKSIAIKTTTKVTRRGKPTLLLD